MWGAVMFWIKAVVSGIIIALASELVKRSVIAGAFLTALPLVSILVMSWMWYEGQDTEQIAFYAQSTLLLLLPSVPMFLLLPILLRQGWEYGAGLMACTALTVCCYGVMYFILRTFNVEF
ncbi:MAG: hypothetical protein CMK59_13900 [Proteobacteria bacterium]|nr:hypothetical protein [Pseudomonadota bacterium]